MLNYEEMPKEKYAEKAHLQNRMRSRLLLLTLQRHHGTEDVEIATLEPEPAAAVMEIISKPVESPQDRYFRYWRERNELNRRAMLSSMTAPVERREPTMMDIIREVCIQFTVTKTALSSARRDAKIVLPRQIVCYLAKEVTRLSLPAIGRQLGGRDHTTILHAHRKIEGLMLKDRYVIKHVGEIQDRLDCRIETIARLENEINSDAFGDRPHPSFSAGPQGSTPPSVD